MTLRECLGCLLNARFGAMAMSHKPSVCLAILSAMFLTGCTASMVTSSDALGGVQEGTRWGIVRILIQGSESAMEERQEHSRRLMTEYCTPKRYKVIYDKSEFVFYGYPEYMLIRFECVD